MRTETLTRISRGEAMATLGVIIAFLFLLLHDLISPTWIVLLGHFLSF